jgi:hypothetical protein
MDFGPITGLISDWRTALATEAARDTIACAVVIGYGAGESYLFFAESGKGS